MGCWADSAPGNPANDGRANLPEEPLSFGPRTGYIYAVSGKGKTRRQAGVGVLLAGLALLGAAAAAHGEVFFINGMAVDGQEESAPGRGGFYRERMRQLVVRPAQLPASRLGAIHIEPPARPSRGASEGAVVHVQRAMQLLNREELAQALIEFRHALVFEPANPYILTHATLISATIRDFVSAETYSRRFIELHPEDAAMWALRAAILMRLARIQEAGAAIREAVRIDPENVSAHFSGEVLKLVRSESRPERRFWERRRLDEVATVVRWLREDREVLTGMLGEADFGVLCEIILGGPVSGMLDPVHDRVQVVMNAAVEPALRLEALEELAGWGLGSYGIQVAHAGILGELGRWAEAKAIWEQIARRHADFAEALLNYGLFLLRAREPGTAVRVLRESRRLLAASGPDIVSFVLASALALDGRTGEAMDLFRELARTLPDPLRDWAGLDPVFLQALDSLPEDPEIRAAFLAPPPEE